jgi:cold shock protein
MNGVIKKLVTDKGFGFITVEGESKDLFFHGRTSLVGVKFEELNEGDKVTFEIQDSDKGPNATNVQRV